MCSRYSLTSPPEAVRQLFGYSQEIAFPPRYNVAPTQPVMIVRNALNGSREPVLVRWGLIPSWVKDPGDFTTLINARGETAAAKPSFRAALRHKRCLVPATGFYEWTGKPGSKQPHHIYRRDGQIIAFGGLWEHWMGPDGSEIETMAILTTAANRDMTGLHDRMPLILEPDQFEAWLDCSSGSAKDIAKMIEPGPEGRLQATPVSKRLNNSRNEGPELLRPDRETLL